MTTFSMYSASIPVFKQILNSLLAILDKAEAHAADKKIEPAALLQFRLFPDMLPFTRQIQIACDFAKGAAADCPKTMLRPLSSISWCLCVLPISAFPMNYYLP